MSESALQTQIAAAKAYEEFFVPALCGQWAPRVTAAARIQAGDDVLDVACGTGVLAREAASRSGPAGLVAGVDASPGMLAVARAVVPAIEWREAKAEVLPYPDQRFDAVVSQFGLMFFTDRPRALSEMLRVLRRGGRLAVAVWASRDCARPMRPNSTSWNAWPVSRQPTRRAPRSCSVMRKSSSGSLPEPVSTRSLLRLNTGWRDSPAFDSWSRPTFAGGCLSLGSC